MRFVPVHLGSSNLTIRQPNQGEALEVYEGTIDFMLPGIKDGTWSTSCDPAAGS